MNIKQWILIIMNSDIMALILTKMVLYYFDWGIRGTVTAHWTAGEQVDPALGAWFITKFISLAQVDPGPV